MYSNRFMHLQSWFESSACCTATHNNDFSMNRNLLDRELSSTPRQLRRWAKLISAVAPVKSEWRKDFHAASLSLCVCMCVCYVVFCGCHFLVYENFTLVERIINCAAATAKAAAKATTTTTTMTTTKTKQPPQKQQKRRQWQPASGNYASLRRSRTQHTHSHTHMQS